jgi:polar amino acid transport system permease protein
MKPDRQKTRQIIDIAKFLFFSAAVIWLLGAGTAKTGYHWQWYRVPAYLFTYTEGKLVMGPLVKGLMITLHITAISLLLAFALGLGTALLRLSTSFTARSLARAYLEMVRNTPLLIQLFFLYFVVSPILDISAFSSAVLALSLFEGAYASEIIRAGIVSIHTGQWEAASSLGLSKGQAYRHIILPQAFIRILPPITSQAISLIKDSALVSTIAIYDLTMQGQAIVAETFLTFEIWFTVAAIYLFITITLSLAIDLMKTRLQV